jgi:hypothetical protein
MNGPEPDPQELDSGVTDDLKRLGRTCGYIFRFWTIPMSDAPIDNLASKEEKESFRIASIAIITFLFFALRPDVQGQFGAAVIGLALTGVIAFATSFLFAYKIRFSEHTVIGSYSFLACIMLVFIIAYYGELPVKLESTSIFAERVCLFIDSTSNTVCDEAKVLNAALFVIVVSGLLLFLKSRFLDKNKNLTVQSFIKGMVVVVIFTTLVSALYLLPLKVLNVFSSS